MCHPPHITSLNRGLSKVSGASPYLALKTRLPHILGSALFAGGTAAELITERRSQVIHSSDTMAVVILPVDLAVMLAKTFLVVDAIRGIHGHKSVIRGAAQAANSSGRLGSHPSSPSQGRRSAPSHPPVSTQRRISASASAGSPKVRSLHVALVVAHIVALLGIAATILKYALPVTVSNCTVTHQVSTAFAILFPASLLTFLLFKVDVTNGNRKLSCWEKGVIWISRAYAWIYLPLASIFVGASYPGGTNEAGTLCVNGFDGEEDNFDREASDNAYGYAVTNATLLVQYVLLLILFVRPLMVRLDGAQSGGAVYRRVVVRNISCTAAVVVAYIITTIITVTALLRQHPDDNTNAQVVDVSLMTNEVVVLCLTEIALPLGFTSCWKACSLELCLRSSPSKEGLSDVETSATPPPAELC